MRLARCLAWTAVLVPVCGLRVARAETPDRGECVAAYENAQVSMRRGRLMDARRELGVCLSETCARVLRGDCAQWLNEVETRLPAVILSCEGPDGRARTDARVLVDGVPFAERLEGIALEIDPGEHVFRFELDGQAPLEVRSIIHEGDKVQRVAARFGRPAQEAPTRPVPWTVYALGGVGISAAVGFTIAGIAGHAGRADLERCKPDCSDAEVSKVSTKFLVADVLLGVSILSLGAAAYLYFTRAPAAPVSAQTRLRVAPLAGGGGAWLTTAF